MYPRRRFSIPLPNGRTLSLGERTLVMGIINVTPDSFSDGGSHASAAAALAHCERLLKDGADILDIGGESTRPGAQSVGVEEELARVLSVLDGALKLGCPVSLDTVKPEVMRVALERGVDIVNDVAALRASGAVELVASHRGCGVCLMHMQGEPRTMQTDPRYADVVSEVRAFLAQRIAAAEQAGIARARIVVDPGFGFGKTLEHNVALLRGLETFVGLGVPVLAGLSRKSMIGKALGLPVTQRLHASVALAMMAVQNGARIVRVHDVAPTVQAIRMWEAVYSDDDRSL